MRERVAAATVKFLRQGGQDVLVPGNLIVTAAHVLGWTAEGGMALGDDAEFIESLETVDGRRLRAYPLAVEAVSDIAILGALDDQWSPTDADAFEAFCEATAPIPLAVADYPLFAPFPVHVLAHTGEWIGGRAQQCAPEAPSLAIEMDAPIRVVPRVGPW
jgi:hypothetical protein